MNDMRTHNYRSLANPLKYDPHKYCENFFRERYSPSLSSTIWDVACL